MLEKRQAEKEKARASAGQGSPMPLPRIQFGKTPPKVTRLATVTESNPAGRRSTGAAVTQEGTSDSDSDSDSDDDRVLKSEKGSGPDEESAMDDGEDQQHPVDESFPGSTGDPARPTAPVVQQVPLASAQATAAKRDADLVSELSWSGCCNC